MKGREGETRCKEGVEERQSISKMGLNFWSLKLQGREGSQIREEEDVKSIGEYQGSCACQRSFYMHCKAFVQNAVVVYIRTASTQSNNAEHRLFNRRGAIHSLHHSYIMCI